MARGRSEAAWLVAKCTAEAVRACWVKEPMPPAAMNPYYREVKIDPQFKMRAFLAKMHATQGGRR